MSERLNWMDKKLQQYISYEIHALSKTNLSRSQV
jgi:hypothetical protein